MDRQSGMFQYAALLANALAITDDVSVITPEGSEIRFFSERVKVHVLPVGDTKRNFIFNTLNFFNLKNFYCRVMEDNPDIIHFHNPYVIWPCLFFPALGTFKVVITLPDGQILPGQERFDLVLGRKIHIRRADGVIVLSEHDRKIFNDEYPDKKCCIIPHGSNPIYLNHGRSEKPVESDVLFFGGIQYYKGLEFFLRAIPIILQQRPGTRIAIFAHGDISKVPDYRRYISMEGVLFINTFIPHEKVAALFQGTKIVVLPYTEQVHSGVIPLAYAFGKPVVASTCLKDQVIDKVTGVLVEPKDIRALAGAITELLNDTGAQEKIGAGAKRFVENELSWDIIAKKTKDCYLTVLKH